MLYSCVISQLALIPPLFCFMTADSSSVKIMSLEKDVIQKKLQPHQFIAKAD